MIYTKTNAYYESKTLNPHFTYHWNENVHQSISSINWVIIAVC